MHDTTDPLRAARRCLVTHQSCDAVRRVAESGRSVVNSRLDQIDSLAGQGRGRSGSGASGTSGTNNAAGSPAPGASGFASPPPPPPGRTGARTMPAPPSRGQSSYSSSTPAAASAGGGALKSLGNMSATEKEAFFELLDEVRSLALRARLIQIAELRLPPCLHTVLCLSLAPLWLCISSSSCGSSSASRSTCAHSCSPRRACSATCSTEPWHGDSLVRLQRQRRRRLAPEHRRRRDRH